MPPPLKYTPQLQLEFNGQLNRDCYSSFKNKGKLLEVMKHRLRVFYRRIHEHEGSAFVNRSQFHGY